MTPSLQKCFVRLHEIIQMFYFLIDNILVLFGGRVFQQTFGISMGTNCASLLTDLFLHAYDADILQGLLKYKDKKLAQTFNSIFRYIDDVLSLINSRLAHYLHHIYSKELEAKDSTDTQMSSYYLDLHLENVNGGRLRTKVYDKLDDFTFSKSTSPSLVAIFHGHQRM